MKMLKGIDISEYNGNIDMKKVREDGVEFVIIRLGYGKNKSQIDKKFYENYRKAIENSIPVGIYLYSYAINIEDAKCEAKRVIDEIKNLKIEYPVFIDMEDADGYKAKRNVSNEMCIDICDTFCNLIEKAGYYAGIYANLNWLKNRINSTQLDRYDKWVAQWAKECTYNKQYGIWQYSSKGKISGINGNVDLNYALKDYKNIIKKANLNHNKSEETIIYVVRKNDTLSKIAQIYNKNWKDIYEWNKEEIGNNPDYIIPGQKLIIKGMK